MVLLLFTLEQTLEVESFGSYNEFEAVPGFGLKCNVSNIDALVGDMHDVVELNDVNTFVEGNTFSLFNLFFGEETFLY